ncbi:aldo/keto reductase [Nocardia terpenica]|uniref:Aldo/keto reductase n=1 Tax=Nocardia terpenica TaxID=455432 RepID=A0A161Z6I6_9NOCA|nr:aldo/keto reductase [Nocardia terpenica]KZM75604.1 aldo/keto reductase [Nocardia terpenica]NQE86091.1 aldo/keto reductase [Nocardia terpenica]
MKQRLLGALPVSEIGLGCMGMSQSYGPSSDDESVDTIRRAIDLGTTFLDTSDMYGYGNGHNETLIGKAIAGRRDEVVLATKFGIRGWTEDRSFVLNSSPEYARQACEDSLRRLGVDVIDLYYLHRRDRSVPIEEIVGGMSELVRAGKVRYIGLSEVNAETLRRAHATHPITALESEYSLFERYVEDSMLPTCRELGIGLVAFSPLGRGFLTGTVRDLSALADDDYRRTDPRFLGDNLAQNLRLLDRVTEIAAEIGATTAQVALAWLLTRDEHVVPIPGTKRLRYLTENAAASEISLSEKQIHLLTTAMPAGSVAGERYPEGIMRTVDA